MTSPCHGWGGGHREHLQMSSALHLQFRVLPAKKSGCPSQAVGSGAERPGCLAGVGWSPGARPPPHRGGCFSLPASSGLSPVPRALFGPDNEQSCAPHPCTPGPAAERLPQLPEAMPPSNSGGPECLLCSDMPGGPAPRGQGQREATEAQAALAPSVSRQTALEPPPCPTVSTSQVAGVAKAVLLSPQGTHPVGGEEGISVGHSGERWAGVALGGPAPSGQSCSKAPAPRSSWPQ